MRNSLEQTNHMGLCQGKALFAALQGYNTNRIKGRNEILKLFFDKNNGIVGGGGGFIYEDMHKFEAIYPEASDIFKKGINK